MGGSFLEIVVEEKEFELAQALEQAAIESGIEKARGDTFRLKSIGRCWYCEEPLAEGVLFCDDSCAADYEFLKQRRIQNQ